MCELIAAVAALRAERDALAVFWRLVAELFLDEEIGEMDEETFYDLATTAGLMEQVPYDPEKHDGQIVNDTGDLDAGDLISFVTSLGRRLRAPSPADHEGGRR